MILQLGKELLLYACNTFAHLFPPHSYHTRLQLFPLLCPPNQNASSSRARSHCGLPYTVRILIARSLWHIIEISNYQLVNPLNIAVHLTICATLCIASSFLEESRTVKARWIQEETNNFYDKLQPRNTDISIKGKTTQL